MFIDETIGRVFRMTIPRLMFTAFVLGAGVTCSPA